MRSIPNDDIEVFYGSHWIGNGYLRAGSTGQPLISDWCLRNHRGVGSSNGVALNIRTVWRLDWTVDRDEYVQTVACQQYVQQAVAVISL